jgi:hypothetical protein
MNSDRRLRERLDALGPRSPRRTAPRPDAPRLERADRIGEFWGYPESRAFAELPIDCEGPDALGGGPTAIGQAHREPAPDGEPVVQAFDHPLAVLQRAKPSGVCSRTV